MNYEDMKQSELRLNCACVDALRAYLGMEPLYDETEDSPSPGQRMTVSYLAERIQAVDPDASIQLEKRKQGVIMRVFVNAKEVLHYDGRNLPLRRLLPTIEERWGRVWE